MSYASENPPPGPLSPPVSRGVEIPPEPAHVSARTLAVASRLLCGSTTFFFLAFLFAYFYLRSLDQDGMWRPAHVHPSQGLGAAFIACIVLSGALAIVAARRMKAESPTWLTPATAAVVLGLAAVALQCIEFTGQDFGPTRGAYTSVFVGWSGFYLIAVLATMYWLETHVATELRARRAPAGSHGDVQEPDRLIAPGRDAAVFYWSFLAGVGVLTYVVLYLL